MTPSHNFNTITEYHISQALSSQTNPYAAWGKLFYDDTQKHMWPENSFGSYVGNIYRIPGKTLPRNPSTYDQSAVVLVRPDSTLPSNVKLPQKRSQLGTFFSIIPRLGMFSRQKNTSLMVSLIKDFTFQAQVQLLGFDYHRSKNDCSAGLVFRSDEHGLTYYCFMLHEGYVSCLRDSRSILWEGEKPFGGQWAAEMKTTVRLNRPNVLAVVVQETSVYLYLNLQLVATLNDRHLSQGGTLGLFVKDNSPFASRGAEFSYAKVWVEE
jgi:hypothetical protein